MKPQAARQNEQGNKHLDQGQLAAAEVRFRKAIEADPKWSVPWYNLGLVYKRQHLWDKVLKCNQRATALDPNDREAWWNMGIAAAALGNWAEARRAWKAYGIKVPPGEGEVDMNIGPTPIRINPDSAPEVVWGHRIDPARAIIKSVPLPQSGRRYGDLLLHDGEPKGFRKVGVMEVPVFNELGVLTTSEYATYEVVIEAANKEDRQGLADLAQAREMGVEDWSTIRMLCKQCSEGRPHDDHEPQGAEGPLVRFGIAAHTEEEVQALLQEWRTNRPSCLVHEVHCVLEA